MKTNAPGMPGMAITKVGWEKKVNAFSRSEPPVQGFPRLCQSPSGSLHVCQTFSTGYSTQVSAVSIVTCSIDCAVPMGAEKLIEPFNTATEIQRNTICVLVSCLVFNSVHGVIPYSLQLHL